MARKRKIRPTPEQMAASAARAANVDLTYYDEIVVSTSGGKDSQVMLDVVYEQAERQGVTSRIVAGHCDLGAAEWQGTAALAERQAQAYGVRFRKVTRPQGDMLHELEHERKLFPDDQNRWCTSDQKRGQIETLITALVTEATGGKLRKHWVPGELPRATRVLSCLGLRAQEGTERKYELPFIESVRSSSGIRQIDRWLPVHQWTKEQVWDRIRSRNLEYHRAYDLGMDRLSCVFCFYAPPEALLLAGFHNRPLLAELVRIEKSIGHTLKKDLGLYQIQAQLDAGYVPDGTVTEWGEDCAA